MAMVDHEEAGPKVHDAVRLVKELEELCLSNFRRQHKVSRAAESSSKAVSRLARALDDEWFLAARGEAREGFEITTPSPYFDSVGVRTAEPEQPSEEPIHQETETQ